MNELETLRQQLEFLKNWRVGGGSTFIEVGNKMLAIADLNLKIAELLLKADGNKEKPNA